MIRRILSICIAAGALFFTAAFLWPHTIKQGTARIVDAVLTIRTGRISLISSEPVIKVVDPETISDFVSEESSQLVAIFKRHTQEKKEYTLTIADIIDATNEARIENGEEPLKVNVKLTESAQLKTEDMIAQQYFEHTSPTGAGVSDLGASVGYNYIIMGENLALGNFTDAHDLVQAWMDSPGHRANILNPLYKEIGIYAARGTYEHTPVWFAVQHFGVDRNACPTISTDLRKEIEVTNNDLNSRQIVIEALKRELEQMNSKNNDNYEEVVQQFDELIDAYNEILERSQYTIAVYNEQVRAFNLCLAKYQK